VKASEAKKTAQSYR